MGINYILNNNTKHINIKNKNILNNKILKISFYTTLIFWGTHNIKNNTILNNFLLGKRYGFSILNAEHQITLLKRASKSFIRIKKLWSKNSIC